MDKKSPFDLLSPDLVIDAVEGAYGLDLDPRVVPCNSYINRVFGLRTEEGKELIAKFYRPGRWTPEALEEEHQFLQECAQEDLPVIPPLPDTDGFTLEELEVPLGGGEVQVFPFCLFEKRGGRTFDAEGEEDWLRLGRMVGRIHRVGKKDRFHHRVVNSPDLTRAQLDALFPLVNPDVRQEFQEIAEESLKRIAGHFQGQPNFRIHGDCHRGNILSRGEGGLLVMDFDDTQTGVPVQDLWLLLPGERESCSREISLLTEGYSDFADPLDLDWNLVEPLRFMRMIHFLSWCARQIQDSGFSHVFPGWGSRSFWIKETEDLAEQLRRL